MDQGEERYSAPLWCGILGFLLIPMALFVVYAFAPGIEPWPALVLFVLPLLFLWGLVLAWRGLRRGSGSRARGFVAAAVNAVGLLLMIAWWSYILFVILPRQ